MNKAKPFVKWAGGKRSIVGHLLKKVPKEFNNYYEPFVGGGALFFALNHKKSFISDTNSRLINTYNVIKINPEDLISFLKAHAGNDCSDYYYEIRECSKFENNFNYPVSFASIFAFFASIFIYLNKTCFNGLYRVNKKNEFNVPYGRYKNPNIVDEENIKLCHQVLQNVNITCQDFTKIKPFANDFVYFDPPYDKIDNQSFITYNKNKFDREEQLKLRNFCLKLTKEKVKIMISNSDTEYIKEIYSNYFKIEEIEVPRVINCKSNCRGKVKELIITNY